MDFIRPILALIHVGSALMYVTGYASTKTLSALAVTETDALRRRVILGLGDKFDFRFQILGGTIVALSGLPLAIANGYDLTQRWIVLAVAINATLIFIGAGLWRRRSIAVREALDAGDDARVVTLLTEPRARALRWIEFVLLVAIVALMVLRPA
ncbi:MAG TPA: DUF2269 family protein [Candidatus Limnocylindrales bacterium]|nr:DUF2269 family protein [Candidatus Limnocylindrales bacterium]